MQDKGFTFLEMILVLMLIGILALVALPNMDGLLRNARQTVDVDQLVRMITLARQEALLHNEQRVLCPLNNETCGQDWSQGLLITDANNNTLRKVILENNAKIILKTFPSNNNQSLQFTHNGFTQTQNGSFYYCPVKGDAKRIVFNQAGRVYVSDENAKEGCG